MFDIGRLCVKIAGRDAGNKCVIVDVIDKNFVMIDGSVRRKKVNIKHLEPLKDVLKLNKGASHEDVAAEFKKKKLDVWKTKAKGKTEMSETQGVSDHARKSPISDKPKKQRLHRKKAMQAAMAEQKPKKAKKKAVKKETPKVEEKPVKKK